MIAAILLWSNVMQRITLKVLPNTDFQMQFWHPLQVDDVKRAVAKAVTFSLGLHTYISTDMGFEFSLSIEGIVSIIR